MRVKQKLVLWSGWAVAVIVGGVLAAHLWVEATDGVGGGPVQLPAPTRSIELGGAR